MTNHPTTLTLAMVAVALNLSACGGGDTAPPVTVGPTPSPSPSPTPSPTPTPTPTVPGTKLTSDIQYGEGATTTGNMPLFLDIHAPDEPCSANRPTVLFVHGGGFIGGDKANSNVDMMAEEMVGRGINFVSIQYRLDPDNPLPSQAYVDIVDDIVADIGGDPNAPRLDAIGAAFEDTVTALGFLEANQDTLCVETSRIAYWGSSAGAFTVLQVAYGLNQFGIARPEPRVVVNYWGNLFRVTDLEVGEAPFFIIHGTDDATVDYQGSLNLANQADAVGVSSAFYTVNGAGHGFGATGTFTNTFDGQTLLERTGDFVEAHLTGGTPIYGRFDITP